MFGGFHGGIHPQENKEPSAHLKIEELPAPKELILPLSMHIGAPSVPIVAVGDRVLMGQKIAEPASAVSAALHAPVSGTVKEIAPRLHPNGLMVNSIVLENDECYEPSPLIHPSNEAVPELSREEIIEKVRQGGVVGLGGAAFPTAVKLSADPNQIDTLIINGAECEPYITADNRALREYPEKIIAGIRIVQKVLEPSRTVIGIEENKPHAIQTLRELCGNGIEVAPLKVRYPQGAEKQMILTLTGREVPPGGLPASVGCCVLNVSTAAQIFHAVVQDLPLTHKIITVSGSAIAQPKNLRVPIGTPIKELIAACGGTTEDPAKLLMGGPMMGVALPSDEVPVIKGTNAILAFTKKDCPVEENPTCIRCGKCVSGCPMHLTPIYLYMYERKSRVEDLEKLRALDCIECGCCSYNCPGRLPLVQSIRNAKALIQAAKRKERRS